MYLSTSLLSSLELFEIFIRVIAQAVEHHLYRDELIQLKVLDLVRK